MRYLQSAILGAVCLPALGAEPAPACPDVKDTALALEQQEHTAYDFCAPRFRYPREARAQRLGGEVLLDVTVAEDGAVREAKIISAQPVGVFDQAALKYVRGVCFEQRTFRGQPSCYRMPYTLTIRAGEGSK